MFSGGVGVTYIDRTSDLAHEPYESISTDYEPKGEMSRTCPPFEGLLRVFLQLSLVRNLALRCEGFNLVFPRLPVVEREYSFRSDERLAVHTSFGGMESS